MPLLDMCGHCELQNNMNFFRNILTSGLLLAVVFLITPDGAAAASPAVEPFIDLSGTPFEDLFTSESGGLSNFFGSLFDVSISIGALLAVIMIAWSGWEWMTSDIVNTRNNAKKRLQNALIGLLMLLATVLILRQINPDIVSLKLFQGNPPTVVTNIYTDPSLNGSGGVTTTNPSGFCRQSTTNFDTYLCYTTLQECAGNFGVLGCSPFNNQIGSGYIEYRWIAPSVDAQGNLQYCNAELGSGWVNVSSSWCNTVPGAGYSCCGLSSTQQQDQTTDIPAPIPGETLYPLSEISTIPDGSFCYRTQSNAYCLTTEAACTANYLIKLEKQTPGVTYRQCALFSSGN